MEEIGCKGRDGKKMQGYGRRPDGGSYVHELTSGRIIATDVRRTLPNSREWSCSGRRFASRTWRCRVRSVIDGARSSHRAMDHEPELQEARSHLVLVRRDDFLFVSVVRLGPFLFHLTLAGGCSSEG